MLDKYRRSPYGSYEGSDLLRFPVSPLPPVDRWSLKTRGVIVTVAGRNRFFPLPAIAGRVDRKGRWETEVEGRPCLFLYRDDPPTVSIEPLAFDPPTAVEPDIGSGTAPKEGDPIPFAVRYAYRFAWHAIEVR